LLKEHADNLVLVLQVVSLDLFYLQFDVSVLRNQLLVVCIATLLLTLVLLCQLSLVSIDVSLSISVGICDSLSPLNESYFCIEVTFG
jgi:hypothetical protein